MMRLNRKSLVVVCCLLLLSLVIAYGRINRTRLGTTRAVSLPPEAILDERSTPVIAVSGKFGFISTLAGGSLISFSIKTGKILSSTVVGDNACSISMAETGSRRLITVPAANDPESGRPAVVNIIDASSPHSLELVSFVALPSDAHLMPSSRALLTPDGRFGIVASVFKDPVLFSFNVATGEILSRLKIDGRPSDIAMIELPGGEGKSRIALTSAESNTLSIAELDGAGVLSAVSSFKPSGARFEESNNPAFSPDGSLVYVAAATGEQIFSVDPLSGTETGSIALSSPPHRITVSRSSEGEDIIGVVRIRRPAGGSPGGVTVLSSSQGRMSRKSEFQPPEPIEFSTVNNVQFDETGQAGFVGARSGILFAFDTATGEMESNQDLGGELLSISLNEASSTVAAVKRTAGSDEIVVVGFDLEESSEKSPVISSLVPDTVEQGRPKDLSLAVNGKGFGAGAGVLINGAAAAGSGDDRALAVRVPAALFASTGDISIQVKTAGGKVSQAALLHVVEASAPVIDSLSPAEVSSSAQGASIEIRGRGFRRTSVAFASGQQIATQFRNANLLSASVPRKLLRNNREIEILVRDSAHPEFASNTATLRIYGPKILKLKASVDRVLAGAGSFKLLITGENFADDALVELNGQAVESARVRRIDSKSLRVGIKSSDTQQAGKLSVVVRNPGGTASDPVSIDVAGPVIKEVAPSQLMAGIRRPAFKIHGKNFRKKLRVFMEDENGQKYKVHKVRFQSSTKVVVKLRGPVSRLLDQPGSVNLRVVNPNDTDGVSSLPYALKVAGPEVASARFKPVPSDSSKLKLVIAGSNIRKGAVVQFIKEDSVVLEMEPLSATRQYVMLTIRSKRVEALGKFQVRVVNPRNVRSNSIEPEL